MKIAIITTAVVLVVLWASPSIDAQAITCNWNTEFLSGPMECNHRGLEERCPGVNIFYTLNCGYKCYCRNGLKRDANLACVPANMCSTVRDAVNKVT